jgi:hypothetical protein
MSVHPHGTVLHPLDGFSRNLMFEDFLKNCQENLIFITISQA